MKNSMVNIAIVAFTFISCNQKKIESEMQTVAISEMKTPAEIEDTSIIEAPSLVNSTIENQTITENLKEEVSISTTKFSIDEILSQYISMKNALVKDDAKSAAKVSKNLFSAIKIMNANSLSGKQKKEVEEIVETAKEQAELITKNVDKIEIQREHFLLLSEAMNDLVSIFGTKKKLYQDFCPMANEGKGAIWISETKEIKNPYYGSEMLTCGSMKKEF